MLVAAGSGVIGAMLMPSSKCPAHASAEDWNQSNLAQPGHRVCYHTLARTARTGGKPTSAVRLDPDSGVRSGDRLTWRTVIWHLGNDEEDWSTV